MDEVDRLVDFWSDEKVLEMYRFIHRNVPDDWYPVMYVTFDCENCGGEAHPFENHKSDSLKIECFDCGYFYLDPKDDDYYRESLKITLNLEMTASAEQLQDILKNKK